MTFRFSSRARSVLVLSAVLARPQLTAAQATAPASASAAAPTVQPQVVEQLAPPPSASPTANAPAASVAAPTPAVAAEPNAVAATPQQAAAATPTAVAPSAVPTIDAASQRVDALEKRVDALSRLKLSGYVQAQYVHNDSSHNGIDTTGKPLNKDLFEVRRARLRATYTLDPAEFLLNIDAIPSGVSVKEAELSIYVPWTHEVKTKLTAGLFYIPFGYEVQESDSVLPFVERTLAANRLFPGSRDVGVRAQGDLLEQHVVYQLAAVNGNPISDAVFPGTDPNGAKDFVGRVGVHFGGLRAGISGLIGQGYLPPAIDDTKTTTINEAHSYGNFIHRAAAFDVTYNVELPVLGELALYAEGVISHNLDRSKLSDYPKVLLVKQGALQVATNSIVDANQTAGYLGFTQHLGQYVALGARGEIFDPSTAKKGNGLGAVTLVGHVYPAELLRLTLAYQLNYENPSVANNVFWARGQVKF
ncbi:MAG TPA: porin [Polyangiales bacterium]